MKSLIAPLLNAEQCAACKFCCTFAAFEAWETPLFSADEVNRISRKYGPFSVKQTEDGAFTLDLSSYWKINGEKAYAPCPFLDSAKGCVLSDSDKPFDCKIWPLRIMKKDENLVIALTPTCREINKLPVETVKQFVLNGAGECIYNTAEQFPAIIKPYKKDFPILMEKRI